MSPPLRPPTVLRPLFAARVQFRPCASLPPVRVDPDFILLARRRERGFASLDYPGLFDPPPGSLKLPGLLSWISLLCFFLISDFINGALQLFF